MTPIMMLQVAVVLLAIAAAGGLVMAGLRFGRKANPPAWLSMLHGLLAGAGLTLSIYAAAVAGVSGTALVAIVLLLLAASGGAVLNLAYQWKQRLLPTGIVVAHALLAVVGFALLAKSAFVDG